MALKFKKIKGLVYRRTNDWKRLTISYGRDMVKRGLWTKKFERGFTGAAISRMTKHPELRGFIRQSKRG